VANSYKGHGVSFMSGEASWHHGSLTADEFSLAIAEVTGVASE